MKRTVNLIMLLCLISVPALAQFQIGDAQVPSGGKAGSLSDEDLETFKKSTTIFVLQTKDKDQLEDFKKSIGEIWKITPFLVVLPDGLAPYHGKKYSIFNFGGFTVTVRSSSGMTTTHTHISYDLTIPDYNKHGESRGRTILARFILSPDFGTVAAVSGRDPAFGGRRDREERQAAQASQLTRKATYYNWGPGQIRGYLKSINDHLAEADRRGLFDEIHEKDQLKALAKDTLYLPMYLKDKINPFTGEEKTQEDDGDDDASDVYPYPHRYIGEAELEQKILSATKPIYHLIYVRSSTNKYVSVVEGKSGTIIYSDFKNLSFNFKMKDLKKVAGYVE